MHSNVSTWSVDDVADFLHGLELNAVVENFRYNAVNGKDLVDFTDTELETELNLTKLQVRKIRKGLENYNGNLPSSVAPSPTTECQQAPPVPHTPALSSTAPCHATSASPVSPPSSSPQAPQPPPPVPVVTGHIPPGQNVAATPSGYPQLPQQYAKESIAPPVPAAPTTAEYPQVPQQYAKESTAAPTSEYPSVPQQYTKESTALPVPAASVGQNSATQVPPLFTTQRIGTPNAAAAFGGLAQDGVINGFRVAELQQFMSLKEAVKALEMQQVESKSVNEAARVRQFEGQLAAERQKVAQLQHQIAASKEKLAKYEGDGWFPLKHHLKEKKTHHYQAEISSETEQLRLVEDRIAALGRELAVARSTAANLAGQKARLDSLRREKDALERGMITAWGPSDAAALQLAHQATQLSQNAMQAKGVSDAYVTAAAELKAALADLNAALQSLQRGNMMTTFGMVDSALERDRWDPMGGDAGFETVIEMVDIHRANDLTKQAGMRLQRAAQILPTEIPYIPPAEIKSAAAGLFTDLLLGGVMGQMVMKMKIQESMGNVQLMAQHVGQALSWVDGKAQQLVGETNRLQSMVAAKESEKHGYEQRALSEALAAVTRAAVSNATPAAV